MHSMGEHVNNRFNSRSFLIDKNRKSFGEIIAVLWNTGVDTIFGKSVFEYTQTLSVEDSFFFVNNYLYIWINLTFKLANQEELDSLHLTLD